MPQMPFTARWVEVVKPPAAGQVDYFDIIPPERRIACRAQWTQNLVYYVSRSGGRLAAFHAWDLSGAEPRRGPEQALQPSSYRYAKGGDPAAQKQMSGHAPLVADIATQYLDMYAKVHKKSWREDARLLTTDVLPQLGTAPGL